jgi:hypothetical protein
MGRVVQGSLRLRFYCYTDSGEEKEMRREFDHYRNQNQNRACPLEKQFPHVGGLHDLLPIKHNEGKFGRVGTFKFHSEMDAIEKLRRWSGQDVTIV